MENFGGHAPNLDFGIKGGKDEANLAFTVGMSTAGHFLQGLLASFVSFPAVAGCLAKSVTRIRTSTTAPYWILERPHLSTLVFLPLLSACMTVYQSYNLVKRMYYYDNFSRSSYWSNGLEWAMGYVVGVVLGRLVTKVVVAIVLLQIGMKDLDALKALSVVEPIQGEEEEGEEEKEESPVCGFGKVRDYITKDGKAFVSPKHHPFLLVCANVSNAISIVLLVAFSLSVLVAAIELGNSWNMCEDDDEVCGNGNVPTAGLCVSFLVVYGVVYGVYGCVYKGFFTSL